MLIWINEEPIEEVNNITLFEVVEKYKKHSDVYIVNSFQEKKNKILKAGDKVTLIRKGETLSHSEIEKVMYARSNIEVIRALKNRVIGIAGLGGLESNIAISLARSGIGKLIIADYDVVEPSNLNRQHYYMADLGKLKTEALRDHIKRINPFVEVQENNIFLDSTNVREVFKKCNVVIEAFDNAKSKAMIVSEISKDENKSVISGNGMAGYYSSNEIKTRKLGKNIYISGDGKSEASEYLGLMCPRVSIVGGHMANTAIRIILGEIEKEGIL